MIEYIVIATPDELKLVEKYLNDNGRNPNQRIVITGVGGINIYKSLQDLSRNAHIVNLGYAGSPNIPKGTIVVIGESRHYHPNVEYPEPAFKIGNGEGEVCFTAGDFVKGKVPNGVYDMELAYIWAMGFYNIVSYKVISDNMSLKEYKKNVK